MWCESAVGVVIPGSGPGSGPGLGSWVAGVETVL